MITPETLGRRIKWFRVRAKLSQLELETAIDASAGMISRIERGQVNPTKESVLKIAKALGINQRELDYIDGVTAEPATQKEIELAIEEVAQYLDREDVIAYMSDDRWRFTKFSKGFLTFLKASNFDAESLVGKTVIEALVEKDTPLLKFLDRENYEDLLKWQLKHYYSEMYFTQDDEVFQRTVALIESNLMARKIWREISSSKSWSFYAGENRLVYFNTPNGVIPMRYSREPLVRYPRFDISEYIPVNVSMR